MKKMRLLLVNVGHRSVNMPSVSPPLGILSLAAHIRNCFDLDIRLIDQRAENCSNASVLKRIAEFAPDIAGFRAVTPDAYLLPELSRGVRQALPGALIILGGPHISAFGPEGLEPTEADIAVNGEGEVILEQIMRAFLEGDGFGGIPGLIRRDASGEIVTNPGSIPFITDLDSLPFPAYDLLDMRLYWRLRSFSQTPPHRYMALMTSRGCPYHCAYCHRIFGKRFRAQSAARIVDEIEHYVRTYKVKEIEIFDDIFNCDPNRVVAFAEEIARRNLKLRLAFPNALRCDILTTETVEALASAGICYAACALESGSPRIQKAMGKRLNIPRFLEGVAMLAKHGVLTHGFTMLGFPTETAAEMQQTIDVACGSRLHTATFFTVTPYPNTRIHQDLKLSAPEKLAGIDYADSDYTGIRVNASAEPDDVLFALQRKAWRQFYINPRRMWRLLRVYPGPLYLPAYLPMFLLRVTKR